MSAATTNAVVAPDTTAVLMVDDPRLCMKYTEVAVASQLKPKALIAIRAPALGSIPAVIAVAADSVLYPRLVTAVK